MRLALWRVRFGFLRRVLIWLIFASSFAVPASRWEILPRTFWSVPLSVRINGSSGFLCETSGLVGENRASL